MALQQLHSKANPAAQPTNPQHQPRSLGHQRLTVLDARGMNDAQMAITLLREQTTVVLQLGGLEMALRQRLQDLVHGGTCAMDGRLIKVSDDVLLLQPPGVQPAAG